MDFDHLTKEIVNIDEIISSIYAQEIKKNVKIKIQFYLDGEIDSE